MPAKKKTKKTTSKKKLVGAQKAAKKSVGKKKSAGSKKLASKSKRSAKKSARKKKRAGAQKAAKKTVSKKKSAGSKKVASKSKRSAKKSASKPAKKPEIPINESGFIDAGRLETEIFEPDPEVKGEFAEAAVLGDPSRRSLLNELRENAPAESPVISGGDIDAAWDQSDVSGEETVGGSNPTPDQDIVEDLGKAAGLTYQDNEPLDTTEKVAERDRHRWELEPESSEDFDERNN